MATRLTRFQKRELDRKEQKERWDRARESFRDGIEEAGVDLDSLFHDLSTVSSFNVSDVRWYAWWKREQIGRHTSNVHEAIGRGPVGGSQLQGGFQSPPGEEHTVQMWSDAQKIGPAVLEAAMILASLRMSSLSERPRAIVDNRAFFDELVEGAMAQLRAAGLDMSTLSRTRFVPYHFSFSEDVAELNDMAKQAGIALGLFLNEYAPVRITVKKVIPS